MDGEGEEGGRRGITTSCDGEGAKGTGVETGWSTTPAQLRTAAPVRRLRCNEQQHSTLLVAGPPFSRASSPSLCPAFFVDDVAPFSAAAPASIACGCLPSRHLAAFYASMRETNPFDTSPFSFPPSNSHVNHMTFFPT